MVAACHVYKAIVAALSEGADAELALSKISCPQDALAILVHACFVQSPGIEFDQSSTTTTISKSTGTQTSETSSSSDKKILLPKNWNQSAPNFYAFIYTLAPPCCPHNKATIDLTITRLGSANLLVSALNNSTGKQVNCKLVISNYINPNVLSRPEGTEELQDVYVSDGHTDALYSLLQDHIIKPLLKADGEGEEEEEVEMESGAVLVSAPGDGSGDAAVPGQTSGGGTDPARRSIGRKPSFTSSDKDHPRPGSQTEESRRHRAHVDEDEEDMEDEAARLKHYSGLDPMAQVEAPSPLRPRSRENEDRDRGDRTGPIPLHEPPEQRPETSRPAPLERPPGFEDEYEMQYGTRRRASRHEMPQPGVPNPYVPIGDDDLYPPGIGRNPPIQPFVPGGTSGGEHQGMHPTFGHPIFQGRRPSRNPDKPDDLTVPPGARWDPTGPSGGFGPNRFI